MTTTNAMSLSQDENPRGLRASRIAKMRGSIQHLFTGRSAVGQRSSSLESPKTPQVTLGLGSTFSTRIIIPHLSGSTTVPSDRSSISNTTISPQTRSSTRSPITLQPITPNTLRDMQLMIVEPRPVSQSRPRPFMGVDPEERSLADLVRHCRNRRHRKKKPDRKHRFCFPKVTNRRIRAKIISCLVSGVFLMVILSIYLALALSNRDESQEFHVLLILIILVTTIFFCHALITLCMLAVRQPDAVEEQPNMSGLMGPGGYANPPRPIRVALARDEEAAGIESDVTKYPPPAYGLWRESVRVDPDRIFWQRNEAARCTQRPSTAASGSATVNRPPSYISDDGVEYVIEAAPRSIAPSNNMPLPQHPSERGRVALAPN